MHGRVSNVDALKWENIHPQPEVSGRFVEERLNRLGSGINELAIRVNRSTIAVAHEAVVLPEPTLFPQVVELLVVVAGHVDVNVIIPGDEPAVAHRPDESAIRERIGELVLTAHAVQFCENVQFNRLHLARLKLGHGASFIVHPMAYELPSRVVQPAGYRTHAYGPAQ